MKILKKQKYPNGKKVYYFLGIKIFSYKNKKKEISNKINEVLFFIKDTETAINKKTEFLFNNLSSKINKLSNLAQMETYKQEIMRYGLFDEEYYKKEYPNLQFYNISPLEHYIHYGWLLGLNPSAIFDTNQYMAEYNNVKICPLIHYLHQNRYSCGYCFFHNPYSSTAEEIACYKNHKRNRKATKAVYTCITGDYDQLINHKYINPEWDYICFTDNAELLKKDTGIWEVRLIENKNLDDTRINRYYKINCHIVLPEYEESLYVDGNINILTPYIFDLIKAQNKPLIVPKHFSTNCIYKHFEWALNVSVDSKHLLEGLKTLIQCDHFPPNYGFTENNCLYRKHNSKDIDKIMADWWYLVKYYSKRDQLSFCYVLWKYNILPADISIPNLRSDNNNFAFIKHIKGKK